MNLNGLNLNDFVLPQELVMRIIQEVPEKDLGVTAAVCRIWSEIVSSNDVWASAMVKTNTYKLSGLEKEEFYDDSIEYGRKMVDALGVIEKSGVRKQYFELKKYFRDAYSINCCSI
jgi:F-box domain